MAGESAAPSRNRTATTAIVVAAVAVTAFSLVGIAYLLDRNPPEVSAQAPASSKGLQKFSASEPLMPKYSQPSPPPPAPAASAVPEPQPAAPATRPAAAPAPAPGAPPPSQRSRGYCENCGRIIGIANYPRSGWEVRVHFDDGATQTFRLRNRPRLGLGDRVRLDDDELIQD